MHFVRPGQRRRFARLVSGSLLAVFSIGALPATHQIVGHHCAVYRDSGHTMPGMAVHHHAAPVRDAAWRTPASHRCTHCPPTDCEAAGPCGQGAGATLLPAAARSPIVVHRPSEPVDTPALPAASRTPALLTPP